MQTRLKKLYFTLVIPAIVGFLVVSLARSFAETGLGDLGSSRLVSVALFVLAFAFGVALPILHRTLFVNRTRGRKHVTAEELLRFEELNLRIAMVAPYLALAAYVLGIPRFHFFGTVIASLYAVYYFYPSDKRDRFERKVFRVE